MSVTASAQRARRPQRPCQKQTLQDRSQRLPPRCPREISQDRMKGCSHVVLSWCETVWRDGDGSVGASCVKPSGVRLGGGVPAPAIKGVVKRHRRFELGEVVTVHS